jgi:hypothetical protein
VSREPDTQIEVSSRYSKAVAIAKEIPFAPDAYKLGCGSTAIDLEMSKV